MSVCLPAMAGVSQAYDLHEWGTFTTISGSDGVMLAGLQVEEERLPFFVQGHNHLNFQGMKSIVRPVANVRVKMETPVIYFYGDKRENVSVHVGFDGGTISQWYPPRTAGDVLPPLREEGGDPLAKGFEIGADGNILIKESNVLDFGKKYNGFIHWDAEIIPRSEVDSSLYFRTGETHNWIYPQVPDSNIVKVGDEYEQYLFYRGMGNFTLPLTLTVDSAETLTMDFKGKEKIPFALAFERTNGKVRYKVFSDGLAADSQTQIAEGDGWTELPTSIESDRLIYKEMRTGLMAQGLTQHEADGMVKTWWNSYFGHEGLRVFWILPQNEVERILPMKVKPAPENQVRVIVGRSEVLRPRFEKQLLAQAAKAEAENKQVFYGGRYYLAHKERVETLRKLAKK